MKALPDALELMWSTVLKDYDPIVKASSRPTSWTRTYHNKQYVMLLLH